MLAAACAGWRAGGGGRCARSGPSASVRIMTRAILARRLAAAGITPMPRSSDKHPDLRRQQQRTILVGLYRSWRSGMLVAGGRRTGALVTHPRRDAAEHQEAAGVQNVLLSHRTIAMCGGAPVDPGTVAAHVAAARRRPTIRGSSHSELCGAAWAGGRASRRVARGGRWEAEGGQARRRASGGITIP